MTENTAAGPVNEHPVLAAQRRIAESFGARARAIPGLPSSGLAAIIAPILAWPTSADCGSAAARDACQRRGVAACRALPIGHRHALRRHLAAADQGQALPLPCHQAQRVRAVRHERHAGWDAQPVRSREGIVAAREASRPSGNRSPCPALEFIEASGDDAERRPRLACAAVLR